MLSFRQTEIAQTKRLIEAIDPHAFISILDVHEALGEGFTYQKKRRRLLFGH
ncbi:UPF0750 membrane protein ypjC [Lacticaseibacillus paracasei subsp. paracasei CNCM I-4649]|nr:UPF0750 membrane protein ypjC [Lacticaseibacillus paracasei subsp. paracasei CNCM I-4649]